MDGEILCIAGRGTFVGAEVIGKMEVGVVGGNLYVELREQYGLFKTIKTACKIPAAALT
jgi:hypothetical protein